MMKTIAIDSCPRCSDSLGKCPVTSRADHATLICGKCSTLEILYQLSAGRTPPVNVNLNP